MWMTLGRPGTTGGWLTIVCILSVAGCSTVHAWYPCKMKRAGKLLPPKRSWSNRPTQLRLASTGVASEMSVTWVLPASERHSYVEYGDERATLKHRVAAVKTHSYGATGPKAKLFCSAVMTRLKPSTKYFYRAVTANGASSSIFSFRSSPDVSRKDEVGWFFLADQGTSNKALQTRLAMMSYRKDKNVQLALHGGDISYGNGKDAVWDTWGLMMEPVTATLPYMVAPGNHEIIPYDSGEENGVPLQHRFNMPYRESRSNSPFWYAFDWGMVHFTAISSEHPSSDEQKQWLERTLALADKQRHKRPWLVLFAHSPIYTSNKRHGNNTELREWLDPLLDRYGVDLCLWGHDHAYERLYPMRHGHVTAHHYDNVHGTVHVTCGSSGWDLHNCWNSAEMTAYQNASAWGFCHIVAHNASTLSVKFIDHEALGIVDKVSLVKHRRKDSHSTNQSKPEQSRHDGRAFLGRTSNPVSSTAASPKTTPVFLPKASAPLTASNIAALYNSPEATSRTNSMKLIQSTKFSPILKNSETNARRTSNTSQKTRTPTTTTSTRTLNSTSKHTSWTHSNSTSPKISELKPTTSSPKTSSSFNLNTFLLVVWIVGMLLLTAMLFAIVKVPSCCQTSFIKTHPLKPSVTEQLLQEMDQDSEEEDTF